MARNSFWGGRSVISLSKKLLLLSVYKISQICNICKWEIPSGASCGRALNPFQGKIKQVLCVTCSKHSQISETQPKQGVQGKIWDSRTKKWLGQTLCAAQAVTASFGLTFIWSSSPSTATFLCKLINTPCWYTHIYIYFISPTYSGCAQPEYFFHIGINFCAKSAGINWVKWGENLEAFHALCLLEGVHWHWGWPWLTGKPRAAL